MDDTKVYAIAGHEAGHATHWHLYLRIFLDITLLTMIRGPISLGVYLFLPRGLMQLMEVDADITSAIKWNTAKYLAEYLKKGISSQGGLIKQLQK